MPNYPQGLTRVGEIATWFERLVDGCRGGCRGGQLLLRRGGCLGLCCRRALRRGFRLRCLRRCALAVARWPADSAAVPWRAAAKARRRAADAGRTTTPASAGMEGMDRVHPPERHGGAAESARGALGKRVTQVSPAVRGGARGVAGGAPGHRLLLDAVASFLMMSGRRPSLASHRRAASRRRLQPGGESSRGGMPTASKSPAPGCRTRSHR